MITDKIENVHMYREIPSEVKDFLKNLISTAEAGKVILNDNVYANVEKYLTKNVNNAKFEAHEKYIDIQVLLEGDEYIYFTDKSKLTVKEPYDNSRDIVFYGEDVANYPKIKLDGSNFVMLFPHEAHAPQVCVNNNNSEVKKVVVKIKV